MNFYRIIIDSDNSYHLFKDYVFKCIYSFDDEEAMKKANTLLERESKGYFDYTNVRVERMSTSDILNGLNRSRVDE